MQHSVSPRRSVTTQALAIVVLVLLPWFAHAQSVLDAQAQAFVAEHGPLRLAPDPDFAPVDFIDARGRHRGLSADLLAKLIERSGLRVQLVPQPSFDAVMQALESGKIDVASSVYKSPRRSERLLFSNSYLRLPAALIVRSGSAPVASLGELRGRRIAVVQAQVWQELLTAAGFADEQVPAANAAAALAMVVQGGADAYVGDLLTADLAMRKQGLTDALMVSGESGLEAEIGFAIRADLPELKRVLDQALASISVEEEAALRARWEGADALVEPDAEIAVPPSRTRELSELRAQLTAQSRLPDSERTALLQRVDAALTFEAEAEQNVARMARIAVDVEQSNADVSSLQSASAVSSAEELLRWRGSLPQRATLNQLEQLLVAEQAARSSLQQTLARLAQQVLDLQQRPAAVRTEAAQLRARLDELVVPEASSETSARVDRELVLAEIRARQAALAAALTEQANLDALLAGANARKRERQRALGLRTERVQALQQLIAERSDSELAQEVASLRLAQKAHEGSTPAVRDLASENLRSGEGLAARTRRLAELRTQAQAIESEAQTVATALTNTRARIAVGGVTEAVGMLLLAERRRLSSPSALRAQLTALQREIAELQLAQIGLTEEMDGLSDLNATVARLAGTDGDSGEGLSPEQREQLTELLLKRSELLPRLAQAQQMTLDVLEHSEQALVRLLADAQALVELMERNLLWIPSHRPIDASWWPRLSEGWADLLSRGRWLPSLQMLSARISSKPLWILALLLPLALWWPRRRLSQRLSQLALPLRGLTGDRYRYTLQALAISAVLAAPMPLLCFALGHMFQSVGEGGRFTHSLGLALKAIAPFAFAYALTAVISREDGLAHMHMRWLRARRDALMRVWPYVFLLIVPLLFIVELSIARGVDAVNSTVLRSTLLVLNLILAGVIGWMLGAGRLLASRVSGPDPHPRVRRSLRLILVAGLLVLAVIPLFGYVYTSAILLSVFLDTLQVVLAVTLAHGLVLRWLVLGERRIAMLQRQQVVAVEPDDAGVDVPVIGLDTVNLGTISAQSRSLLRALVVVSLGAGLLWSLSDVAPALRLLDEVVLWQSSATIDGVSRSSAVSLGDALLALLALVFGVVAARNMPGLLEIALLRRFTEDASVRYAAVAVTRYLITFLVVVTVSGLLGVQWGQLQWLAAAFSVGLGFGLQEIFGNFVAGLILLFERPFRVGDVVTIGDLSGTVRRVHTRATTIKDFDNKDIVIPNKTFITERFVNWTLSDTVTRITLRVGVGYESDPEQVRSTLLALAHSHPAVLAEPAPVALFMALADSTLNFELRCFVSEIGDRLRTTDDLHSQIVSSFRAGGIRLAYPQMDVHLHRDGAATETTAAKA